MAPGLGPSLSRCLDPEQPPEKYPIWNQYKHAKSAYRIRNWPEHAADLRRRGDLTIWFSDDAIKSWRAPTLGQINGRVTFVSTDGADDTKGVYETAHDAVILRARISKGEGLIPRDIEQTIAFLAPQCRRLPHRHLSLAAAWTHGVQLSATR
jgi:hypothetical protein